MSKTHWYAPFKGVFSPIAKGPDEGPFLCVTFNIDYAPFIRGALISLLQRQMWAGSDAVVNDMIMKVHQLLYMFGQETACELPAELVEGYEEMASLCESLRWHDGKLQALCCGEWTDIPGLLPGGDGEQPGDGTPQPEAGGCQSYHANLLATGQYLLPTTVNTGDVLTLSNPRGTASDGAGLGMLFCPLGNLYFLGHCDAIWGPLPGDPMDSNPHMCVIAQIGGVFYDASTPITVGAGVVNQPVIFQVNDSDLADNAGGYNFDIEVCNNQVPEWTSVLDFRLSTCGFALTPAGTGEWVAGQGWHVTCERDAGGGGGGAAYTYAQCKLAFTSAELLYIKMETAGNTIGLMTPSTLSSEIYTDNPTKTNLITGVTTAGGWALEWAGDASYDNLALTLMVGYHAEPSGPTPDCPGGGGYIRKLTVSGKGPKPPELP